MEGCYKFTFLVLGDSGVGKTAIIRRFCKDAFADLYRGTVSPDLELRTLTVREKNIRFLIWDTPGQDRFRNVIPQCYRGALGILVVYDVTELKTVENLRTWQQEIQNNADENVPVILVGNKNDGDGRKVVSKKTGETRARDFGAEFIEVSAKYNINIQEAFTILAEKVLDNFEPSELAERSKEKTTLIQNADKAEAKKRGCC